jgi:hypothetical protein
MLHNPQRCSIRMGWPKHVPVVKFKPRKLCVPAMPQFARCEHFSLGVSPSNPARLFVVSNFSLMHALLWANSSCEQILPICKFCKQNFALSKYDFIINTRNESEIEFSGAAVMPVLFSTYGAHGAVRDHFFSVQYASTTTDLPSTPLWHCILRYFVDHIVQRHDYLCTSTAVGLLSTNDYDIVLQNTDCHHYTGAEPLHDM